MLSVAHTIRQTMTDPVSSIRVLIAEDDENARALLVELLTTLGHTVVAEVSTGREAIERATLVVPDVVLQIGRASCRERV